MIQAKLYTRVLRSVNLLEETWTNSAIIKVGKEKRDRNDSVIYFKWILGEMKNGQVLCQRHEFLQSLSSIWRIRFDYYEAYNR